MSIHHSRFYTVETWARFLRSLHKFHAKYSVALANGSLALSSAYLSIGLKKGDEFITTPRSFIATTSSAALFGAKPKFADVDKNSGCITAKTIEPLINKI